MDDRELTLAELLDDPMIQAVMAADRVDPAELKAALTILSQQASAHAASRTDLGLHRVGRTVMVNFFIHRPVFASVIAIIMVLTGLIAYSLLPVAQFPDITPPQVVVTATYPGASSQVVADTVTTPLEQQINGVPGMAYMSSVSANDGSSTITITFNVGYPIDTAAVDVQNRVSQAAAQLPAIVNQAGIIITKKNPNILLGINIYFAGRIGRSRHPQQLRLSAARRPAEAAAGRRRREHLR